MVYYQSVKITINVLGLVEIIINMVIWHHNLPDSIYSSQSFDHCYATFLVSKNDSLLYFTLKLIAKTSAKAVQ